MRSHGKSKTPEYKIWVGIIRRCHSPRNGRYQYYGGRGIVMCDRWRHDFLAFLGDMGLRPSPEHSVERKDNNGNYEPGNCRWATQAEQKTNTRAVRLMAFEGLTLCESEWARRLGIIQPTIAQRLRRGWSTEKALSTPVRAHKQYERKEVKTYA